MSWLCGHSLPTQTAALAGAGTIDAPSKPLMMADLGAQEGAPGAVEANDGGGGAWKGRTVAVALGAAGLTVFVVRILRQWWREMRESER